MGIQQSCLDLNRFVLCSLPQTFTEYLPGTQHCALGGKQTGSDLVSAGEDTAEMNTAHDWHCSKSRQDRARAAEVIP